MRLLVSYAPLPGTSKELVLGKNMSLKIGRLPECDLVLNQSIVSGQHAILRSEDGREWFLEDLNSRNGTFIDGVRVLGSTPITKPSSIRLGLSGPILRVQPTEKDGPIMSPSILRNRSTGASPTQMSVPVKSNKSKSRNHSSVLLGSLLGASIFTAGLFGITRLPTTGQGTANTSPKAESSDTESNAQPKKDAAAEISSQIHFFEDLVQPHLNVEIQYRKAIGDMARIQYTKMRKREAASIFPTIILGRQAFTRCDTPNSPGVYNPACHEILVGFNSDVLRYDYPIEVLYVLAHEYAHHLVEISEGGSTVSGLDNELTADCFAGYMAGFWDINGKLTEEELMAGFNVMQFVAKAEPSDSSNMHGDPGQRQGAFFGGFERARGNVTQQYQNFCRTLDRILVL
jgi:pSer/pThr/pTyr-binding forkhead associated (FHA) protein